MLQDVGGCRWKREVTVMADRPLDPETCSQSPSLLPLDYTLKLLTSHLHSGTHGRLHLCYLLPASDALIFQMPVE